VTGEIVLAQVRFRLDDDSAGEPRVRLTFEDRAEHFARYDLGLALIERARKNPAH
jgi:hypothetical protein